MTTTLTISPAIIATDDPDILEYLKVNGYYNPDAYENRTQVLESENLHDVLREIPRDERTLGGLKLADILETIVYEHHIPDVIIYESYSCITPRLLTGHEPK